MRNLLVLLFLFISSVVYSRDLLLLATQYHPGQPGFITASGDRIIPHELSAGKIRWVALSRDLIHEYPFGTVIEVHSESHKELNGLWVVKDKMGSRHRKCIDFLMPRGKSKLGRTNVIIRKYKIEDEDSYKVHKDSLDHSSNNLKCTNKKK